MRVGADTQRDVDVGGGDVCVCVCACAQWVCVGVWVLCIVTIQVCIGRGARCSTAPRHSWRGAEHSDKPCTDAPSALAPGVWRWRARGPLHSPCCAAGALRSVDGRRQLAAGVQQVGAVSREQALL